MWGREGWDGNRAGSSVWWQLWFSVQAIKRGLWYILVSWDWVGPSTLHRNWVPWITPSATSFCAPATCSNSSSRWWGQCCVTWGGGDTRFQRCHVATFPLEMGSWTRTLALEWASGNHGAQSPCYLWGNQLEDTGGHTSSQRQFSSVAQSCLTLCDPMNHSTPGLPVHHQLLEFTQTLSIESMMPSSHLILYRPLLLLPPIPPSIRVFSNKSTFCMRWPKYWSFSFSISPSNEHPGLISMYLLSNRHQGHFTLHNC